MKVNNIFLDMDGVLCDFIGGVLKLVGQDYKREEIYESWPHCEWNFAKVLGYTSQEMWRRINNHPEFWYELKPTKYWADLYNSCRTKATVTVLTAPAKDPQCAAGKVKWLYKAFGDGFSDYIITSKKHLLAKDSHLLIDDKDSNVDCFRAHGGRAILFPAPWNSLKEHYKKPMIHVKSEILKMRI